LVNQRTEGRDGLSDDFVKFLPKEYYYKQKSKKTIDFCSFGY